MSRTVVAVVNPCHPDSRIIAQAASIVRRGGIVAFPTETVYGLAVNALDKCALRRLSRIKKRPAGKHYTVHVADRCAIAKMGAVVTPSARRLMQQFWPGPLTIILATHSGTKIGFRMPDHAVARRLIRRAQVPVVAPSANVSGQQPPTSPAGVLRQLDGKIDMLIAAGHTAVGKESTVIDVAVAPPVILRAGAVSASRLRKVLCHG